MVGAEDAEPVETAGDGGGDDALLEVVDDFCDFCDFCDFFTGNRATSRLIPDS